MVKVHIQMRMDSRESTAAGLFKFRSIAFSPNTTIHLLFPLALSASEGDFLFVYIQGGNSKLFLSSFLYINIFLDSDICIKKAKEVDSEIDRIQVF